MLERPLSPWRGPDGPLARLRGSRRGLAVIALISLLLIVFVIVALSVANRDVADRDRTDPEQTELPAGSGEPTSWALRDRSGA